MWKRLATVAVSSTALATAFVSSSVAAPADLIGTWKNTNSNTRGITRVVISSAGGNALNVQVFGKCSPTDCDWGKTNLITYGNSVQDKDHRSATTTYNKSFANTLLTLTLSTGNQIRLQSFTQFTDKSGRQNYASTETLQR
jgi:hypothetical protein